MVKGVYDAWPMKLSFSLAGVIGDNGPCSSTAVVGVPGMATLGIGCEEDDEVSEFMPFSETEAPLTVSSSVASRASGSDSEDMRDEST